MFSWYIIFSISIPMDHPCLIHFFLCSLAHGRFIPFFRPAFIHNPDKINGHGYYVIGNITVPRHIFTVISE
jgi:hypothetical protein